MSKIQKLMVGNVPFDDIAERITVGQAKASLNKNKCGRKLSQKRVNDLVEADRLGEWEDTVDPIRYDSDGYLRDGQTRLAAQVILGKTKKYVVVRGLSEAAFNVLDQGAVRTLADVLHIHGEANSALLGTTLKFLWVFQQPNPMAIYRRRFRIPLALKVLEANGAARKIVESWAYKARPVGFVGILLGAYARGRKLSMADADEFFIPLMSGVELAAESPAYLLRKRLLKNATSAEKLTPLSVIGLVVKCWNAHRNGEALENLRLVKTDYEAKML